MRISYNPLWKMLIDKGMNKKDLREKSGISTASIAKLGKGENITTDVLLRICEALDCNINDIMETLPDEPESDQNNVPEDDR
jgi:putative transcriptional regulator